MRAVVSRVKSAAVSVEGTVVGSVGQGYAVLLGVCQGDGEQDVAWMARKLKELRLFPDAAGKMACGLDDVRGSVLLVSQFTLCGEVAKGRRPDFHLAAGRDVAEPLYLQVGQALRDFGVRVAEGRFGAHMEVSWVNDGPVTVWLDTKRGRGEP